MMRFVPEQPKGRAVVLVWAMQSGKRSQSHWTWRIGSASHNRHWGEAVQKPLQMGGCLT